MMRNTVAKGVSRSPGFLAFAALLMAACSQAPRIDATPQNGALADVETVVLATGQPYLRFKVDANWPVMPFDLLLGQVSGVAVDDDDDVWVVHRPHSLTATDTGLAAHPPRAVAANRP